MRVFVAVDVAYFLYRSGHFADASQIVEKHKAGVKIDPFQYVIGYHCFQHTFRRFVLLEGVVDVADELIAAEQMFVVAPLIEDIVAFLGRADGIQHIAVALRVNRFLKRLYRKAEIYLIGGDVLPYIRQIGSLQAIKKNEE